jgi:hypothetical protein
VTGAVTLPPGLYGRNVFIQDATGGILVYLRSGDYPALAAGDQVRVTGWTRQFHGEVELSVPNHGHATQIHWLLRNEEDSDLSAGIRPDE